MVNGFEENKKVNYDGKLEHSDKIDRKA